MSLSDANGVQDVCLPHQQGTGWRPDTPQASQQPQPQPQLNELALPHSGPVVMKSGGSWGSAKAPEAGGLEASHHGPATSSVGSSMQFLGDGSQEPRRDSGGSCREDQAGIKMWPSGSSLMRRFSQFGRSSSSHTAKPGHVAHDQAPMQLLRLSVRMGIATGQLQYDTDVANCAVKDKARGEEA